MDSSNWLGANPSLQFLIDKENEVETCRADAKVLDHLLVGYCASGYTCKVCPDSLPFVAFPRSV